MIILAALVGGIVGGILVLYLLAKATAYAVLRGLGW